MNILEVSNHAFVLLRRAYTTQRVLLATVLTAAAVAASAAGALVYRVFTKDSFAYASYYQYDNDGCGVFALEVFASESMTRTNDYRFFYPIVRAQLSSYNYCTGVFTFMSGADEVPQISINKQLSAAAATATVVMQDEFGVTKTVQLTMYWSGGELTTDKYKYMNTTPYSRTIVKSTGSTRSSTSITGALVLDGLDLLGQGNSSQDSGIFGFVTGSSGSSIDVLRYR